MNIKNRREEGTRSSFPRLFSDIINDWTDEEFQKKFSFTKKDLYRGWSLLMDETPPAWKEVMNERVLSYYLEDLCSKLESRLSSREQELLLVLCQLRKQSREEGRGKSLLKTVFERLFRVQDLRRDEARRFDGYDNDYPM